MASHKTTEKEKKKKKHTYEGLREVNFSKFEGSKEYQGGQSHTGKTKWEGQITQASGSWPGGQI